MSSSSSQESVAERLNRQMIGGNTPGFLDMNAWLDSLANRPTQGEEEEEEGGPMYNVWIPVPTGLESAWKSLSSGLADCDDPMKWYLIWMQLFFVFTELSGAPGENKSVQAAEEGDVE